MLPERVDRLILNDRDALKLGRRDLLRGRLRRPNSGGGIVAVVVVVGRRFVTGVQQPQVVHE